MDINALLFSLPALTPLVGSNIYAMVMPNDKTQPAITYQVISRTSWPTLNEAGLTKMRVQFDVFSADYFGGDTIRETLISDLSGYTGSVAGTNLQNTLLINVRDTYEDQLEMYRLSVEFYLIF